MPDRLDTLLGSLRGVVPPAPFAPAAAIRRRGRQRARRQAGVAAVAVLVVAGLGTGGVTTLLAGPDRATPATVAGGSGSPTPPAGSTPPVGPTSPADPGRAPTGITDDMFLSEAELGPGRWRRQATHELLDGWWWECPALAAAEVPSLWLRQGVDAAFWTSDEPERPETRAQLVERFEPGTAAGNVEDVRTALRVCTEGPAAAEPVAPVRHETIAEGFAGDESLLVRTEQWSYDGESVSSDPYLTLVAVVRVGDLVTTLPLPVPDGQEAETRNQLRLMAQAAAARLG